MWLHTNLKFLFIGLLWSAIQLTVIKGVTNVKNENQNDNNNVTMIRPTTEKLLDHTSILFGLTKVTLGAIDVSPMCYKELQYIRESILRKEIWAIKALDASASKSAGFVLGHNFWLGSPDACNIVRKPAHFILSKQVERKMNYAILTDVAPFEMGYRVVLLQNNSPLQIKMRLLSEEILQIGLCLPVSCGLDDVKLLFTEYIERGMFPEDDLYEISPEVIYVKDLKLRDIFFKKLSLKFLIVLILWSSVMIMWAKKLRVAELTANETNQANVVSNGEPSKDSLGHRKSIWIDIIKCYDLERNYTKLFTTNVNPKSINAISAVSGIRAVCMFVGVYMHIPWFTHYIVNDKPFLGVLPYIMGHALIGVGVVDIYLATSAFLYMFIILRNTEYLDRIRRNSVQQNIQHILMFIFHRFLRLAPLCYVTTLLTDLLLTYIGDTQPQHIAQSHSDVCAKNAWYNFIFIQNFITQKTPTEEICAVWTWTVALEMQLFIVATIILFICAKYRQFAKNLVLIVFALNLLWIYGLSFHLGMDFTYDYTYTLREKFYYSTFTRALPYIVSSIVGWCFMVRRNDCVYFAKQRYFYIMLAAIISISLLIDLRQVKNRLFLLTVYTFGRVLIALSICWTIIRSALSMPHWWLSIFEFRFLKHIDRVLYAISLLNPLVIMLFYMQVNTSVQTDFLINCVLTVGFMCIIYVISVAFTLIFEMPYQNISSILLNKQKKQL